MKYWILGLAMVVMALPGMALAGKKATTIDELAEMFDSSRCKTCHSQIYKQWEQSHHARPMMGVAGGLKDTPLAVKGATPFSPDTPEEATIETFPCFKCHLPQALTHAEDSVAVEYAKALLDKDREKIGKLQITCKVCHNYKAIVHRLSVGEPQPDTLYSTGEVARHPDSEFTSVKKSAVMERPLFCGQCHGLGPNLEFDNPVQCANLYGSYLHAYVPAGGTQTCQDCHMEPIDGKADHLIAPNFNDKEDTIARYQQALALDVQTLGYEWLLKSGHHVPKVVVNTKIDSSAGHRIPDG
ncbi:MAG: multiheme c-type cytochrome ExtKL [Desulfurivibrio sp.]|nr:multiheme c-type cytochrome ExtKL [Desulfurivibrio sp.]